MFLDSYADSLASYISSKAEVNSDDKEKINYSLKVILNETFKIIILFSIFASIRKLDYFMFSFIILTSIRSFSGGIHFNTFTTCLSFTILFFLTTCVFFTHLPKINLFFSLIIIIFTITIIIVKSPKPSENRPIKNKERKCYLKLISLFITIVWLNILFFYIKDIHYFNCGLGTIFIQAIQLLKKGSNNEKSI